MALESDYRRLNGEVDNLKIDLSAEAAKLTAARTHLTRLRASANKVSLSFDSDRLVLEADLARYLVKQQEWQQVHRTVIGATEKARADVSTHRRTVGSVKVELAEALKDAGRAEAAMEAVKAQFRALKLPEMPSATEVERALADSRLAETELGQIFSAAETIELRLDAATTAAALRSLRQAVDDAANRLAATNADASNRRDWLKYFNDVGKLLLSQQTEAIRTFTSGYGSRTAIIQRRLRAVYGFDDIQMSSEGGSIRVRVTRNSESLRPIDYFSQSQQQTLLLGLFLTACSSQTWSSFAPVFLDDPVTHFDDLNTYAFLDLLLGLMETDFGNRQFVLSTCDEKMLLLARQKFRHLGEQAKFYRFNALGAEGPFITELPQ